MERNLLTQKGLRNMFETLGDFSVFYWSLAALITLVFIYEDKLIALEDKLDAKKAARRKSAKGVRK